MELQPHTVAVVACKGLGGRSGTHTTVPHDPWSMVVAPVQHDTCVLLPICPCSRRSDPHHSA
eukprot:5379621-Amphidinium_carterae.1